MAKIVSARLENNKDYRLSGNKVWRCTLEDSSVKLLPFYDDEISISKHEIIGLTEDEANKLKFDKDVAYLRS
jgi:hypothetical protein